MRQSNKEKVPELSKKYEALFKQAEVIYERNGRNCDQTITGLSESLELSPGYLSDRRNDGELRRPVERAVLLRYGVGPVALLKTIIEAPPEGLADSITRGQRIDKAWREFHASWPFWRTGTVGEFAVALAQLDPDGGLLDEEPLRSARISVANDVSTKSRSASRRFVDQATQIIDRPEDRLDEAKAGAASPAVTGSYWLPPDLPLLTRAFHYALTISTTARASGAPTISHLQQVVGIVLENGGSDEEAAAGFLHDVAEDYGEDKLAEIEALFGINVASIVRECSDSFKVEGQHRRPWFPRKHDFLKSLPKKTVSALRVMVADKLHNARSMLRDGRVEGGQLWVKLKRTPEETTAYFTVAQRIFAARLPSAPTTELGLVVAMLETSFCNASLLGEKITAFSREVTW